MHAVVDVGTNTALLVVGARDAKGALHIVADEARITRLGEGVARTGVLREDAMARTLAALADYRDRAHAHGASLQVVATEGLRLASNRAVFEARALAILDAPLQLISGEEEAQLAYASVACDVPHDAPLSVLDIGGGSTELATGIGPQLHSRISHKIGSVRLTEACVHNDPPSGAEMARMHDLARQAFAQHTPFAWPTLPILHGVAGTVTTTAALLLGLSHYERAQVDGTAWTRPHIESLLGELAAVSVANRIRPGILPAGRADVIVAGLIILLAAMEHVGAHTLLCRDRGLRFALLERACV